MKHCKIKLIFIKEGFQSVCQICHPILLILEWLLRLGFVILWYIFAIRGTLGKFRARYCRTFLFSPSVLQLWYWSFTCEGSYRKIDLFVVDYRDFFRASAACFCHFSSQWWSLSLIFRCCISTRNNTLIEHVSERGTVQVLQSIIFIVLEAGPGLPSQIFLYVIATIVYQGSH